jgi:hypothetical protein
MEFLLTVALFSAYNAFIVSVWEGSKWLGKTMAQRAHARKRINDIEAW